MPVNGLISKWDKLHLALQLSGGFGQVKLQSLWTPDAVNVNVGIELTVTTNAGGSGSVNYNGPNAPFGGYSVSLGAASSGLIDVYFNNWKLYGVNPGGINYLWHVFWDSIDIYVNGSFSVTLGSGDVVSNALGPSWIPVFCGLVSIFPVSGGLIPAGPLTISGGWRFLIGANWYAPPISIPPRAVEPAVTWGSSIIYTAPFQLNYADPILSTSTYGNHLLYGVATTATTTDIWTGSITLIPDLPKGINRMNSDYAATFWRWACPRVQATSVREWNESSQPGTADTYSSKIVVDRLAAGTFEVNSTPGSFESYFTLPSYSSVSTVREHDGPAVYGNPGSAHERITSVYPYQMDSIDGTESWSLGAYYMAPYMSHQILIINYFNSSVCHPHWSTAYYTGPWNLYGGTTHWEDYWGPIREQYMSAQKRRNHIVSCPLETSGWTPFLDNFLVSPTGDGMRWIGISRWQTQDITPPATVTLDSTSSPAWSVETSSCSLAFAGSITVTPISSTCTFDLDVLRFDVTPFFYVAIASSVTFNWPGTNIDSVKVYGVSIDGTTTELFTTGGGVTIPGTYTINPTPETNYAGSWGIDNGAGVATDLGIDVASGGMSTTLMNDVRYQEAFGFLKESQTVKLRFVVVPTSILSTFSINYPVFTAATNKLTYYENGQINDLLYNNGPGVRLGNHVYYPGGLSVPPLYAALGYKGSIIDALCDKRILFMNTSPTGGTPDLTTECTNLFDSFEGNSVGQIDRDSMYFVLPENTSEANVRLALVNTWSEVPPLVGYPTFDRNANWGPGTNLVQETWTLAQATRVLANPTTQVDVLDPSGTIQTTTSLIRSIGGWKISEMLPIVDNTESVNWKLVINSASTLIAHITPWHGYFCSVSLTISLKDLTCIHDWLRNDYYAFYIKDKDVHLKRNNDFFSYPVAGSINDNAITSTGKNSSPSATIDSNGMLYLMYVVEDPPGTFQPCFTTSLDRGTSWRTPVTNVFISGAKYGRVVSEKIQGFIVFSAFEYASGTSGPGYISTISVGPGDTSLPAEHQIKDESGNIFQVFDEVFDMSYSNDSAGRLLLFCKLVSGSLAHYTSLDNGKTFTKVY